MRIRIRQQTILGWSIVLFLLPFVLVSCSNSASSVATQETFTNGQPKKSIHKTLDERKTYYEIIYDSLGRIRELVPYADGVKNGTHVYFRENLSVVALLPHLAGKREGFTYEFHNRQETMFKGESKAGEFNGVSTWFYIDGQPRETGIRINGQKEGKWIEYHENGKVKGTGTYSNGARLEDWKYWKNDGTVDTTKKS